jgi:hypothetical protein
MKRGARLLDRTWQLNRRFLLHDMDKLVRQQSLTRDSSGLVLSLGERQVLTDRIRLGAYFLGRLVCLGIRVNANMAEVEPESRLKFLAGNRIQGLPGGA